MSAVYLCRVDLVEPFHINSISMEKLASVKNLDMEAAVEMKTDLKICMIVKKDVSQSRRNVRDQILLNKIWGHEIFKTYLYLSVDRTASIGLKLN